jgi:hypothetical protein
MSQPERTTVHRSVSAVWFQAACLAYGQALHADGVWGGELLHGGSVRRR